MFPGLLSGKSGRFSGCDTCHMLTRPMVSVDQRRSNAGRIAKLELACRTLVNIGIPSRHVRLSIAGGRQRYVAAICSINTEAYACWRTIS